LWFEDAKGAFLVLLLFLFFAFALHASPRGVLAFALASAFC
jgi:hypothetical protein